LPIKYGKDTVKKKLQISFLPSLYIITVISLTLGQFTSIYKNEGANVYLYDFLIFLFAFVGFLILLSKKSFRIPLHLILFFPFTGWALISIILQFPKLNTLDWLVSFSYLIRWVTYLLSATVIFNLIQQKYISPRFLKVSIVFAGLVVAILGFIQLVVLPDFTVLDKALGWDPHKNRLASTFFDPNFVGGFLSICLGVILGEFYSIKENLQKKFFILSLPIILLGILLTFSRSSWAMAGIIFMILGMFRSKKILLGAILIVFSAYFFVPRVQTRITGITDPADSAHFRLASWKNAIEISKDNLLFGVGFNTFRHYQKDFGFFEPGLFGGNSGAGTDSSFLLILATTGIAGLVLFVSAYFLNILRNFNVSDPNKLMIFAILIGLFVHSQFVNSLFFPQIMFFFTILLVL